MNRSLAQGGGLRNTRVIPSKRTILTAVLMATVVAVSCFVLLNEESDDSDAAYATEVWVNGANLSEGGQWSPGGTGIGGYGSYNSSTGVLTFDMLRGQFTGSHEIGEGTGSYAGIYANGDLTIKFTRGYSNGYNINFAPEADGAKKMYGVYVQGNLTIISDINPNNLDWIGFNPGAAETESIGIYAATGGITIDGFGVELRSTGNGTSYGNVVADKKSFLNAGIYSKTTLTIKDSKVKASAVSISPAPKCEGGGTVYSYGMYSNTDISITDSTVTASSGHLNLTYYVCVVETETSAIHCNGQLSVIKNTGDCNVTASGGDIYYDKSANVNVSNGGGKSYGIRASSMTQTGGTVYAVGGTVFLPLGVIEADSVGLYAGNGYTGSGVSLNARGSDASHLSCGMRIYNGDLNAGSNGSYVIHAGFSANNGTSAKSIGLMVGGSVNADSGTTLSGYGGVVCYPQYTIGIYASGFNLTGDARVTGYGGPARAEYTSDSVYDDLPFKVEGGSMSDSYGIFMIAGNISVATNAQLRGVGGNIVGDMYRSTHCRTAGLYFYTTGTITGSGKVIATGGQTNYGRNYDAVIDTSCGIYCEQALTINGTRVEATGGNVCTSNNTNRPYANCARTIGVEAGSMALSNNADVQAAGGILSKYPHYNSSISQFFHDSTGVYIFNGALTVTGSKLVATADTSALRPIGILIKGGITINGTSSVTADAPSAFSSNDAANLVSYDGLERGSCGIYIWSSATNADIKVNGGKLEVSGTKAIKSVDDSNTFSAPYIVYGGSSLTSVTGSVEYSTFGSNVKYVMGTTSAFTVTFDKNDGSGTMSPITNAIGDITLPNSSFTAPTGKHFVGWCTDSSGTGTIYEYSPYHNTYYRILEDVTLYAIWEFTEYEVRFSGDGAEGYMDSLYKHYNDTFPLPENGFTVPNHYSFKCWRIDSTEYDPGDMVTMSDYMIVVYAVWQADKQTVTFDKNGGTGTMASQQADYGQYYTLPSCSFTAPEHKQFKCWSVGSIEYDPTDAILIGGDITVTAVWEWMSYTITFENYDHTELYSHDFEYGSTPTYVGSAPTRGADAQYTYTFSGWSPQIASVSGTATYTAQYSTTVNKYTITFKNADGTTLQSSPFEYGATPVYSGQIPTKAQDDQYTYTFNTWSPTIESVTGEATYTATFTPVLRSYTITFKNEDGTILQSSPFQYGSTPSYAGETPTKASTVEFDYTHSGWSPSIESVTGEATYTATFEEHTRSYTIIFVNEDGAELQTSNVEYGSTPVYSGSTPTKAADARYNYTFLDWSPVISQVTGEATYTATYSSALNRYTVSFETEEGTGTMEDVEIDAGNYILPENGFTAVNNRHFAGWRMCSTTGTLYLVGSTCEILANTTFYAQWEDHEHQLVTVPGYPAICTEDGLTDGQRCTICDEMVVEQQVIPALGHDYSATYEWSADGKSCVVHIVCAHDASHNHVITATVTSVTKVAATEAAKGVTAYSVSGTYDGFDYADTKDVADIPALEPMPAHKEGTTTYENDVSENVETAVTETFNTAKDNGGDVELTVSTAAAGAMTIAFDNAAVNSIAGNAVTLEATVILNSTEVEGAAMVIEVNLKGATFENGKATVSVPFSGTVPDGKVLKVYFINGGNREDMNATLVDGKVIFETSHFSTYAVFFEDAPASSGSNGGGFPIWIVFVIIAVVAVAGVGAFFVVKNKKA